MDKNTIALILSSIAILASFGSLGWQIYEKARLKGRLSVSCSVIDIGSPTQRERRVSVNAVNDGPGKIIVTGLSIKLTKEAQQTAAISYASLFPEPSLFSTSLPATLDVGERATIYVAYTQACFLSDSNVDRVGVTDSFRREHWAPGKDLEQAREQYRDDFG